MPTSAPEARTRLTFRLKFHNHSNDLPRDMEFNAWDFGGALQLVAEATAGRSAELWLDGKPLCRVKSLGGEAWQVGAVRRAD